MPNSESFGEAEFPAFPQKVLKVSRSRKLLSAMAVLLGIAILLAASPNEADWKQVQDAMNRGLPKTAIEKLDPIIQRATKSKNYDEAIKAIAMKISLEGDIQGGKAEEKITRMRAAIAKAPDEMKPAMDAILANWFWSYFQQNQWRFMNRTQVGGPPGKDITTWDLTQILSEIDTQFQKALAQPDKLKAIPIATYDELLEKGNAPDSYRPTLFDFLAHNAIDFYASGAQAGNRQQDAFDLSAESPIFSSAPDFIKDPGCFMSHDKRRNTATGATVISMDITAAYPARLDLDQNIFVAYGGLIDVGDLHFLVLCQKQCFHLEAISLV